MLILNRITVTNWIVDFWLSQRHLSAVYFTGDREFYSKASREYWQR